MTLARGWLLFLAFNLNLAQKNLEEVPVQTDFDSRKVEGHWLTIQLATSHRDLILPTDPLRLSLHSIETRDSGDVDFVLFEKGEGICTGLNVTVHPTELPGQYQGTFEEGSMHVRFVSTDYNHLILYVRLEDNEVINLWALLARRMLEDPTWLAKYLVFVEKFHLQKAPIFNIAGKSCPPAASQLFKECLPFLSTPLCNNNTRTAFMMLLFWPDLC
ncbi:lipocalin-like [Onychomys torridus]|uniref:lipocalin-like n=1 Tax=Onychomys torridus TaxID=38674 RepID=UPI00167F29F5|nr:lipocalin-like [Onychomys torridus]